MTAKPNNPAYHWLAFFFVLILSGGLLYAATRHEIAEHWAASADPDKWVSAAKLEPTNPDNWYRLGRYRELDFEHEDIPLAISYYRRALAIEPGAAIFWLDLAGTYETAGNPEMADQAYRQAQQVYPISGEVAWRYGNFLLRQNRVPEAFQQIRHAVSVDPPLATLAISRCWLSTQDIDQILNSAIPADSEAYWEAIQFFAGLQQPDPAMAVWKRLTPLNTALPVPRVSPLIDLLIQFHRIGDALTVWRQMLSAAGVPPPAAGDSLIWDGGFERDLMNVGFAWRYQPIPGVDLGWDEETVHSGSRSLRIDFDASEKLDFHQLWQDVPVEPNTKYRFSAYIRTDELNTDSGVRFEIQGIPMPAVTASVVGTQPWSLLEAVFSTGPQTELIRVSLDRYPSEVLTSKLEGTVWVDDVSLVPASDPVEAR